MVMTRTGLLCALLAVLAGCASIPLSTMWRLRNFGPEQLAAIDPGALRVAVRMEPDWVSLDPSTTFLALRLVPHEGEEEHHHWPLQEASAAMPGLVPAGESGWQLLRLTPAAAASVDALRPALEAGKDAYAGAEFRVQLGMAEPDRVGTLDAVYLTVRLALAADQDAFTLVQRMRLPVEARESDEGQGRNANAPAVPGRSG